MHTESPNLRLLALLQPSARRSLVSTLHPLATPSTRLQPPTTPFLFIVSFFVSPLFSSSGFSRFSGNRPFSVQPPRKRKASPLVGVDLFPPSWRCYRCLLIGQCHDYDVTRSFLIGQHVLSTFLLCTISPPLITVSLVHSYTRAYTCIYVYVYI